LATALKTADCGVIIDDLAARRAATVLGIPQQGTVGVVLFGKLHGFIPKARPVLEELRSKGMYLSTHLMDRALAQVGE
jgi:predicted nucleic acid-binding protein